MKPGEISERINKKGSFSMPQSSNDITGVIKNTVACAINTEVTGNENVMHNLFCILVNAVINVHVSVQLSGYEGKNPP